MFAAILEKVGFRVTRLAARVRMGSKEIIARTHMLLSVEAGGEPWLADVGFGGEGLLTPIRLRFDEETQSFAWKHRLIPRPAISRLANDASVGMVRPLRVYPRRAVPGRLRAGELLHLDQPAIAFVNMIFVCDRSPRSIGR